MKYKEFMKKFKEMSKIKRNEVACYISSYSPYKIVREYCKDIEYPVSWNVAYIEIKAKTKLSKDILKKL